MLFLHSTKYLPDLFILITIVVVNPSVQHCTEELTTIHGRITLSMTTVLMKIKISEVVRCVRRRFNFYQITVSVNEFSFLFLKSRTKRNWNFSFVHLLYQKTFLTVERTDFDRRQILSRKAMLWEGSLLKRFPRMRYYCGGIRKVNRGTNWFFMMVKKNHLTKLPNKQKWKKKFDVFSHHSLQPDRIDDFLVELMNFISEFLKFLNFGNECKDFDEILRLVFLSTRFSEIFEKVSGSPDSVISRPFF